MKFLNYIKNHWKVSATLFAIMIATIVGVVIVKASSVAITVSLTSINFVEGQNTQAVEASVSLNLDTGTGIVGWAWTMTDPEVATVSNVEGSGQVLSKGAGKTTLNISYSLTDGTNANKAIPVTVPLTVNYDTVKGILTSGAYGTVTCNAATTKSVEWTSSNSNIVSVSKDVMQAANGSVATVTAVSGGTATITASIPSDSLSYSFQVTVGVAIIDDEIEVKQDESKTVATNSNSATNVFWWSENPEVATVENGIIKGVYAGETIIYASCFENDYTNNAGDSITVRVPYEVKEPSGTVLVGDKLTLATTAKPSEVTYFSTDNNVVYYDQTLGQFVAAGTGNAEISVSWRGDTKVIPITVIDALTLSSTSVSMNIGDSQTVTATVTNQNVPVHWSIADPSVASINVAEDGLTVTVTALATGATGYTTLVASQEINGVVKTYTCRVNVLNPVHSLTLMYNGTQIDKVISFEKDTSIYITAFLNFGDAVVPDNTKLSWVSSDESVVQVVPATTTGQQQLAEIRAVGGGNATITVVSDDGLFIATADFFITEGVKGIKLDKESVTAQMALGKYQLKATITLDSDGVDKSVIWASLNPDIVKVDQNGLVTFVSPGETYVSVTSVADSSKVAYCNFIITQQVEGIEMDYEEMTVNVGDEVRLTYMIKPVNATNKNLIWSSSNEDVVKVDKTGMIKAISSGSATIIVQTEDGGYIDMTNITVLQPVKEVVLSQSEISVKKGTIFWLNATVLPETSDNKKVTWTSSDTSLATVTQDGMVSALKVGTVTISCVSEDTGVVGYCVVEITEPVTGLNLNSYYEEIVKGTKFVIVPTVLPADAINKNVTYLSSDPEVASVDENGVVTALKGGTAEIVVTTVESSVKAVCTIVVREYVTSVKIEGSKDILNVGAELKLKPVVMAESATNKKVIWSSSNTSIATVDQTGKVTGLTPGYVVITAIAADGSGASDSVVIRVINPVTSITLSETKITIYVGDTHNIQAKINPENASIKGIVWTSDDENVAKVYPDGDVVGISPGRIMVHATSTDTNAIVASCTVIVKPIIKASSISINSSEIIMLKGKTRQLTARMYPINSNEWVNWLSTDTSVVQVDDKGNIITVGAGQCEVIAYSSEGTVQDSCTIYSMAMSNTSLRLEQYDTFNLYVDGAPENPSWRTTNPRVATVSATGVVTGRMPGECVITGTVDGKTVSCHVRILAVPSDKFININN
jgi:uncharacterized protein YjdB